MFKWLLGSIRNKLLLISGTGTLLLLLASGYGIFSAQHTLEQYKHFSAHDLRIDREISGITVDFKIQVQEWKNILLRGHDPQQLEKYWGRFEQREASIQQALKKLLPKIDDQATRDKLSQFLREHENLGASYRKGLAAYQAAEFEPRVGDKAVSGIDRAPTQLLDEANEMWRQALQAEEAAVIANDKDNFMLTMLLMVVAIIIAFVAYLLFIQRGVIIPANQLVEAMAKLAEGDFSRPIVTGNTDELGKIAHSAEVIRQSLRSSIEDVSHSSAQMAQAVNDLTDIIDITRNGVLQQQHETDQVATAINQMTATVQEVAHNATSAADAATSADREAQNGRNVVSNTIDGIETLAQKIEQAAVTIDQLQQESNSIGTVLDVIRGISEQTNLLALNAAIEAARAGEAGRGFAVVADEVRALASRTQQSTQEIQEMIERLQAGAENAVQVMQASKNSADATATQATETGAALDNITSAVSQINDMNAQIASASEQQSSVAEEINRNIVAISEIADHSAEGAKRINEANDKLNQAALHLKQLVQRFTL